MFHHIDILIISGVYIFSVFFEPTDMYKASKPFQVNVGKFVTMTTPNLNELRSMYKFLTGYLDSEHHGAFLNN